jgi:hypothetical protein
MPAQSHHDALVRRAWLMAIGQLLQTEYGAVEPPVSQRLSALLKKIETCDEQ